MLRCMCIAHADLHHSHHSQEPQALRFPLRTQAPAAKTSTRIHRKIALNTSLQKIFYSYFHPHYNLCRSALTFSAICSACSSDTFLIQQWGGRIRGVSMTGKQRSFLFRFLRRILSSQMPSMFNIPMFNQKNDAKTLRLPISSCTLQFEQTSPVTLNSKDLPSSPLTWVPKRSTHHRWQA